MISDPTGNKPSLQEFMRHQGGLPGESEQKARTQAIENKSKVAPGEHARAMSFLAEEFGKMAREQQEKAEGKKPSQQGDSPKSPSTGNQGSNKATDGQTTPPQGSATQSPDGQLLGPDGQPLPSQAGQGSVAGDPSTTPFGAVIGSESVVAEELKKEANRKNKEGNSPTKDVSSGNASSQADGSQGTQSGAPSTGGSSGNTVDGDADAPLNGNQTGGEDPSAGKLPSWGPPDPPAPTFPPGFSLESLTQESAADHMKTLTKLMVRMSELISKAALEKVEANRSHTQKTNELNQESIKKSQEDQEAQTEKSKQASKVGTCAMVALAVVSFALSAFAFLTGGALLPFIIATIGLALMVVDQILAATGNKTVTETLFGPLMETVIPAIIEFFAGIFEQILLAVGVAADTAQLIANILGSIAAVAAIVVMFLAAKNLVGPMLGKLMSVLGSAAAKVAAKAAPALTRSAGAAWQGMKGSVTARLDTFRSGFSGIGAKIGPGNPQAAYLNVLDDTGDIGLATMAKLDMVARNAEHLGRAISQAQTMASTAGLLTMTGSGIAGTTYDYLANLETAFIKFLEQMMGITEEMMNAIMEVLKDAMAMSDSMMRGALDAQAARNETVTAMVQTMGKGV